MKKHITFACLICSAFYYSQSIEGQISSNSKNISDAEIMATKGNLKFFTVSDSEGKFHLDTKENGEFQIQIYHDGQSVLSEKINIQGNLQKNFTFSPPKTTETQVETVTLSGRKKLIERKVDRLVFNVENSVAAQGLDAIEALGKTPMLRTTDTAISIAGKSSVAVMINDKMVNLSGDALINYLKTLRSDDIAKIEVITTPPAKYEAEGKSGLINIVLKKNTSLGWNASLQTSGNYYYGRPIVGTRSGGTFNYQGKKLSVTTNLSTADNIWMGNSYNNNQNFNDPDYWNTTTQSSNHFKYSGGNVKAEYKINDKNLVGISYNYSRTKSNEKADNTTNILNGTNYSEFTSNANNTNKRNTHNATLFYDIKLDSLGGKLGFSGNYLEYNSKANNFYNTVTNVVTATNAQPANDYKIYSGQVDFEKTIHKVKTEMGAKFTKFENYSIFNFYNLINDEAIFNSTRSNDFIYNEENYAAYASGSFDINEKWKAKLGLRYEYTRLKGYSPTENLTNKNEYGKFFPTAYVSYQPNDNHSFSVNYSRRIGRPYFGELNPFRYFTSEFEYSSGNPYLRPTFTNTIELGYVLKSNFNVTAYYNQTKDNYDRIQRFENGIKFSTTENFYNTERAGFNVSYNYNKIKWLETNVFVNAFYTSSKSFVTESVSKLEGYGADFTIDNTVFLKKDKSLAWNLGYWQDLPYKDGNTQYKNVSVLYTGMKISLMEKNLIFNLFLNDILNTSRSKGTEYYSDFSSNYYYRSKTRSLNLSVTYKFGNSKVNGATKQVKFDDASRAGG